jgi:hypothetical protein
MVFIGAGEEGGDSMKRSMMIALTAAVTLSMFAAGAEGRSEPELRRGQQRRGPF